MSNESDYVVVEGHDPEDAILLLAAAEELGLDPSVVQTGIDGFTVPAEVHDKAYGKAKAAPKKSTAEKAKE